MKDYEKPILNVVFLNCDVITDSCNGGGSCDTEGTGFCIGTDEGIVSE